MDLIQHPAGLTASYPCAFTSKHAHITSTPDDLAYTLKVSLDAGYLTLSGGIAGAVYRIACGDQVITVRAVHVDHPPAEQRLMARRPEPAVDWIEVSDDGGVFIEVVR